MYAIMGITGQVGGAVARNLIQSNEAVRAVVRDATRAQPWLKEGCEIAVADIQEPAALAEAFRGAEGVFILVPPNFDPRPDFPEAWEIGAKLKAALQSAQPGRVVYLSTIGAQTARPNLLTQHTIVERLLSNLVTPITFLRPGWFMENCAWDVAPARENGVIPSFLQPLDRAMPMVATADIGETAAALLREHWTGHRVVELEGPRRISPNDIGATFSRLLGKPVRMEIVARDSWENLFLAQGMKNPLPRIQMLDGFNEGWIDFEFGEDVRRKGGAELENVLEGLLAR
jgi:NAD(P)H dehydrogenase (quinone)